MTILCFKGISNILVVVGIMQIDLWFSTNSQSSFLNKEISLEITKSLDSLERFQLPNNCWAATSMAQSENLIYHWLFQKWDRNSSCSMILLEDMKCCYGTFCISQQPTWMVLYFYSISLVLLWGWCRSNKNALMWFYTFNQLSDKTRNKQQ